MSEIKWIKLSVNMFDDEKIKLIKTMPEGDKIIVIWVQLLCLAGKTNDGGLVYMGQNMAYTDEMLATLFDEKVNIIRIALQTLAQFEMIEIRDDKRISITNWEKHQSTDKMARIKQQNRIRQQKHYYRSKLRELGVDVDTVDLPDGPEELKELVEQLEEKPNVRLTLPNDTEVRSKKKEVRGKKEEERSKKDNTSAELTDEFDELWKLFPNKKGKKQAFTSYKRAIKNGSTNVQIKTGIKNYLKHLENNSWLKAAHGSTWFNQERWNDEYDTNTRSGSYDTSEYDGFF